MSGAFVVGRVAAVALLGLLCACGGEAGAGPQLRLEVLDPESGAPLACKLTLAEYPPGLLPWGERDMQGVWLDAHVLAVERTLYADPCDVQLALPAGSYRLVASAGTERAHAEASVSLQGDQTETLELSLPRAYDSDGWACADFHVHSAPSFDSKVPLDQRLISAVAEGLDAMAATDHDSVGDWEGELARTGMADRLTVLLGDEVSPDLWDPPSFTGHFGVFPLPPDFDPALFMRPFAQADEVPAHIRQLAPEAVIQANHPRWNEIIGYLEIVAYDPTSGEALVEMPLRDLDVIEVYNAHEHDLGVGNPLEVTLADWFSALNQGLTLSASGNSDSHALSLAPLGYPRTCVAVADDSPGAPAPDALADGLRQGRALVTSGPWLQLELAGRGPGEHVPLGEADTLSLQVHAPDWAPVDRLTVVVNGLPHMELSVDSLPFEAQVPVSPGEPGWLVVLVQAEAPLRDVGASPIASFAFSNPIWID